MDIVETRLYAASSHSEADINSIGRRVVSDSLSDTNWRVPKPSHWLELLRNAPDSRWFDFARDSLSSAEHTGGGDKRPVKQWGAPVSLDEVIDTSALPDFKKTRWKDYLLQRQPPEPARAISISSTQLHRTRKQEPVPLHELIPKVLVYLHTWRYVDDILRLAPCSPRSNKGFINCYPRNTEIPPIADTHLCPSEISRREDAGRSLESR